MWHGSWIDESLVAMQATAWIVAMLEHRDAALLVQHKLAAAAAATAQEKEKTDT